MLQSAVQQIKKIRYTEMQESKHDKGSNEAMVHNGEVQDCKCYINITE